MEEKSVAPKWLTGLEAWNKGTHDNPSYSAGSTAFACDVQDLLQSHAALLEALTEVRIHLEQSSATDSQKYLDIVNTAIHSATSAGGE